MTKLIRILHIIYSFIYLTLICLSFYLLVKSTMNYGVGLTELITMGVMVLFTISFVQNIRLFKKPLTVQHKNFLIVTGVAMILFVLIPSISVILLGDYGGLILMPLLPIIIPLYIISLNQARKILKNNS